MSYSFYLPKIETRSSLTDNVRSYIIKGYAATAGYVYPYKKESMSTGQPIRSFKEFFTDSAIENIRRKAKSEKIFIDYGHQIASDVNIKQILKGIETRTGLNLSEEKDYILQSVNNSDIPMFKVEDVKIDEKGLFVEIKGNPFYRGLDETHRKYFDAIWGSLETGFINGMSLNFKPTDFKQINNELVQINDADVYGISLTAGPANDMANITEVAIRCVENVRGERKCQKKTRLKMML